MKYWIGNSAVEWWTHWESTCVCLCICEKKLETRYMINLYRGSLLCYVFFFMNINVRDLLCYTLCLRGNKYGGISHQMEFKKAIFFFVLISKCENSWTSSCVRFFREQRKQSSFCPLNNFCWLKCHVLYVISPRNPRVATPLCLFCISMAICTIIKRLRLSQRVCVCVWVCENQKVWRQVEPVATCLRSHHKYSSICTDEPLSSNGYRCRVIVR